MKCARRLTDCCIKPYPIRVEPRISTFQDDIEAKQGIENALKGIIFFLAVVCVTLTLLGVYAAITIDTESRSKEVAIRKVHGASVGQIMWLFARTYIGIGGGDGFVGFSAALWIYGVLGTDVSHFFPLRSLVLGNCVFCLWLRSQSLRLCLALCALPALIRQK